MVFSYVLENLSFNILAISITTPWSLRPMTLFIFAA